jgi:hypothetical protein
MRKIYLLCLVGWLLVACQAPVAQPTLIAQPAVTTTVTFPAVTTNTPHPTKTSLPTVTRAVYTPPPTYTPTVSPTPQPTMWLVRRSNDLTPAAPTPDMGQASDYQLKAWSAAEAQQLIGTTHRFLEGMHRHFEQTLYYQNTRPVARAYQEAVLRYPSNSHALSWQLGGLVNLALDGFGRDEQAIRLFVAEALNTGQLTLDQTALTNWAAASPAELELELIPLSPLPETKQQAILTWVTEAGLNSFLVVETAAGFATYPLYQNLGNYSHGWHTVNTAELTGDGVDEVILEIVLHSGNMIGAHTAVFDVSQLPPVPLPFGSDYSASGGFEAVLPHESYPAVLQITEFETVCIDKITDHYGWNGQQFEHIFHQITFWPGWGVSCEPTDDTTPLVVGGAITPTQVTDTNCLDSQGVCDWAILNHQIGAIPNEQYEQLPLLLAEWGLTVETSGEIDINKDGVQEFWFTLAEPTERSTFYKIWFIARSASHLKLLAVDTLSEPNPTFVIRPLDVPLFELRLEERTFLFGYNGRTQEPYLANPDWTFATYPVWEEQYGAVIEQLLAGADPAGVLAQLLAAAENPAFENSHEYEYFLGLTYELLGEEDKAVEAYFKAWQNCCDTFQYGSGEEQQFSYVNGFSLMAQAKLEKRP